MFNMRILILTAKSYVKNIAITWEYYSFNIKTFFKNTQSTGQYFGKRKPKYFRITHYNHNFR